MNTKTRVPFVLALAGLGLTIGVATALGGAVKKYPDWTIRPASSSAQNHEGEITFPVRNLAEGSWTLKKSADDRKSTKLVSGEDTGEWLNAETPFAEVFGPTGPGQPEVSQDKALSVRVDSSGSNDTIAYATYEFSKPIPAKSFGFALVDIDVDSAYLTAEDGKGREVSGSELRGNVFNFCDFGAPADDCNDNPDRSTPTWNPNANGGLLDGESNTETAGAVGWFHPTVGISRLKIRFKGGPSAGTPSYRTLFSVRANPIGGKVTTTKDQPISGAKLFLIGPDGDVLDEAMSGEGGGFEFDGNWSLNDGYRVKMVPPDGWKVRGKSNKSGDNVEDPGFAPFELKRPSGPKPKPSPKPSPGPKPVTG